MTITIDKNTCFIKFLRSIALFIQVTMTIENAVDLLNYNEKQKTPLLEGGECKRYTCVLKAGSVSDIHVC
jgi:hypothetical protein